MADGFLTSVKSGFDPSWNLHPVIRFTPHKSLIYTSSNRTLMSRFLTVIIQNSAIVLWRITNYLWIHAFNACHTSLMHVFDRKFRRVKGSIRRRKHRESVYRGDFDIQGSFRKTERVRSGLRGFNCILLPKSGSFSRRLYYFYTLLLLRFFLPKMFLCTSLKVQGIVVQVNNDSFRWDDFAGHFYELSFEAFCFHWTFSHLLHVKNNAWSIMINVGDFQVVLPKLWSLRMPKKRRGSCPLPLMDRFQNLWEARLKDYLHINPNISYKWRPIYPQNPPASLLGNCPASMADSTDG